MRNLDIFTESSLRFMKWDNVLMAGGSVLACLAPIPEQYDKDSKTRREYYQSVAYRASGKNWTQLT